METKKPADCPGRESQATDVEPVFRPFDPVGPLRVYFRNLPHWRQPGATYFVTFRQDDSIPAAVLAEWLDVKSRWLKTHGLPVAWDSRPGRSSASENYSQAYQRIPSGVRRAFEKKQATLLHNELDRCHGSCVLKHPAARTTLNESLPHFHGTRLWLGDFIVMPNHVHALVQPFAGWELEGVLGSIKKWTSRRISEWLVDQPESLISSVPKRRRTRFWQQETYDRIVQDAEELAAFRRYIADNAKKANLRSHEYSYCAAGWLDGFAQLMP